MGDYRTVVTSTVAFLTSVSKSGIQIHVATLKSGYMKVKIKNFVKIIFPCIPDNSMVVQNKCGSLFCK